MFAFRICYEEQHTQTETYILGFFTKLTRKLVNRCPEPDVKAAGDKLLMNTFIRQNFGGGLTLKNLIS